MNQKPPTLPPELAALLIESRHFLLEVKPTSRRLMSQKTALLARIDTQLKRQQEDKS